MLREISIHKLHEWIAFDSLKNKTFKDGIEQSMRTPEEQEAWILSQLDED